MSFALATAAIPGYLAGTWKADPVHSEVATCQTEMTIASRCRRSAVTRKSAGR
jgi:hypothetical protein